MVDQEKLKLMCKGAIYEKEYGTDDFKRAAYTASDYVRYNTLKTLLGISLCYIILAVAYTLFSMNSILTDLLELDYFKVLLKFLFGYAIVVGVYLVICIVYYTYQYKVSKKRLANYEKLLTKISRSKRVSKMVSGEEIK